MNEKLSAQTDKPAGLRRGRKPRYIMPLAPISEEGDTLAPPSVLIIHKDGCGDAIVLRLEGALDTATVGELRDAAFTIVGARPAEICLDLNRILAPLSPLAMETLVTVCRVANMVGVRFSVLVPPPLVPDWQSAGLTRLLPVQKDPRFLLPTMKAELMRGVSADGVLK